MSFKLVACIAFFFNNASVSLGKLELPDSLAPTRVQRRKALSIYYLPNSHYVHFDMKITYFILISRDEDEIFHYK